jgi:hypothetical protein
MAVVDLALAVAERPRGLSAAGVMSGIRPGRRETGVHDATHLIVHAANESTATAHDEALIPFIWQQHFEMDLGADHARDLAVRDADRTVVIVPTGERLRGRDARVGERQRRQLGAVGGRSSHATIVGKNVDPTGEEHRK